MGSAYRLRAALGFPTLVAGVVVFPGAQPSRSRNGGAVYAELRFYQNLTTNPITVYADSGLTTPLTFPVVSDDAGRFPLIWQDVSILMTSNWSTADGQTLTLDDLSASEAADVIIAQQAQEALAEMEALVAGYSGTVLYRFSTTTTDSDPGSGIIRFNNATVGSVTTFYVDNVDEAGVTQTTWLDSFDNTNVGPNCGTILVRSLLDNTKFFLGFVNGTIVDGTGYRKVPVSFLSGGGIPADTTNVSVTFIASGPTGSTGSAATATAGTTTTGAPGTNATVVNSGTSSAAIFDFTIPRGSPGSGDVTSSGAFTAGHTVLVQSGSPVTIQDGGAPTGTGSFVRGTSPTLVTPVLGTPASGSLSNCTADGTNAVGFKEIPQNAQTGSYTLVLADSGKHIYHAAAAAVATYTIPANASVAYPIGTAITFVNLSTNAVTIAITSDTLVWVGAGATGSRTLAQYGEATALKITSTSWLISGIGLT